MMWSLSRDRYCGFTAKLLESRIFYDLICIVFFLICMYTSKYSDAGKESNFLKMFLLFKVVKNSPQSPSFIDWLEKRKVQIHKQSQLIFTLFLPFPATVQVSQYNCPVVHKCSYFHPQWKKESDPYLK